MNEYKDDPFFNPPHSVVQDKGKTVTQLITFIGGTKKTVRGVKTDTIVQSQFTSFETTDGRKVLINNDNVLSVEVFTEKV